MLTIRADLLINNRPYSVTREAFNQFKMLKNQDKAKPHTDSVILDKLSNLLANARIDHTMDAESYEIDGMSVPLMHWIGKNGDYYHLSTVIAKYVTLVGVERFKPSEGHENQLVHEIDVNGTIVGITDHALERFSQRWLKYEKDLPAQPLKTLAKMLRKAEPDDMEDLHRVIRLINNGIVQTDYLRYGPWRMVLVIDKIGNAEKALVTFERRVIR